MDHFNQVISTQFILTNSSLNVNALRVVAVISQKITYLSLSPSSIIFTQYKWKKGKWLKIVQ